MRKCHHVSVAPCAVGNPWKGPAGNTGRKFSTKFGSMQPVPRPQGRRRVAQRRRARLGQQPADRLGLAGRSEAVWNAQETRRGDWGNCQLSGAQNTRCLGTAEQLWPVPARQGQAGARESADHARRHAGRLAAPRAHRVPRQAAQAEPHLPHHLPGHVTSQSWPIWMARFYCTLQCLRLDPTILWELDEIWINCL